MPVTTATCERSYNKLEIIKNYWSSTMFQDKSTNRSIILIKCDLTTKLYLKKFIDEFAIKKM